MEPFKFLRLFIIFALFFSGTLFAKAYWINYQEALVHIPEYLDFRQWESHKQQELKKNIANKRSRLLEDIRAFQSNQDQLELSESSKIEKELVRRRLELLAKEQEWQAGLKKLVKQEQDLLIESFRMHLIKFVEGKNIHVVFEKKYIEKEEILDVDKVMRGHNYLLYRRNGVSPLKVKAIGSAEERVDLTEKFIHFVSKKSSHASLGP